MTTGFPGRRAAAALALLLGLALAAAGCGSDGDDDFVTPPESGGVPADLLSEPVHTIDLARFVMRTIATDWDEAGRFDASWRYDADSQAWRRTDAGRQTTYVGNGSGGSTEVRFEYEIAIAARLTRLGAPTAALLEADRARLDITLRRRHYAIDPAWPVDEPYDLSSTWTAGFRLDGGAPDTIRAAGEVDGWLDQAAAGVTTRFLFGGPARIEFDFPGEAVRCPAERMSATIEIRNDKGVLLDLYSGSFSAAAGAPKFTGRLESEEGPGAFAIDEGRSCPE
jgi:hypothetical protein